MNIRNLYIIGNGFDIHHNIPSRYADFLDWIKDNEIATYDKMVGLYDNAYDAEWWNEFETNLGYFEIREKIENISFECQPDDDDLEKMRIIDTTVGAWEAENEIGGVINAIKDTFHEWVDSLPQASINNKINIDVKESFFITFNYTLTLEDLYDVEQDKILHIHGSLNNDEYILGHDRTREDIQSDAQKHVVPYDGKQDPSEYGLDAIDDEITENTKNEVINQVMCIAKPVGQIIKKYSELFNQFSNVKNVFIYGLSFSDVDKPYLEKAINGVSQNAKYIISYYTKKDYSNIMKFMDDHPISYELIKLEDIQINKQLKLNI